MRTGTNARIGLLAFVLATATLLFASAVSAQAATPSWRIDSHANTTALPGATIAYHVDSTNTTSTPTDGSEIATTIHLPQGTSGVSAARVIFFGISAPDCTAGDGTSPVAGASTIVCKSSEQVSRRQQLKYLIVAEVEAGAQPQQILTAKMEVEGGGAPAAASTVDPTLIGPPPPFGVDAFDADLAADSAGNPFTAAAGHPYGDETAFDIDTLTDPQPQRGDLWPAEPLKDAMVELPPGLLGSTAGIPACTTAELAEGQTLAPKPLCLPPSQVGTALVRIAGKGGFENTIGPIPVFNMVPPPGRPAKFGLNVAGTIITLTAQVRSEGDYGLSVGSRGTPEALATSGASFDFWGVPGAAAHDATRACPGRPAPWEGGESCSPEAEPKPFLRSPTACTEEAGEGIATSFHVDSWFHPGALDESGEPDLGDPNWQSATALSHEAPGYPFPTEPSLFPEGYSGPEEQGEEVGITGCEEVPFEPTMKAQPTTNEADSPSGLEFDLSVPQDCWEAKATVEEAEDAICQSDLKTAEVLLPQGMSVNPSSASGLGGCSPSQIGLTTPEGSTPIHFNTADPTCPDSAKIGTVKITTPLIEEELEGGVYLAKQGDNPFKSLLALYIVAKGNGVIVKLPAHVQADTSGQLTTVVDDNPQLPFEDFHLEFFSGSTAPLLTPPACGTFATEATLTPWSHEGTQGEEGTPIAQRSSSFQITQGPNGGPCPPKPAAFAPKLSAGTQNPLAGAYSPFALRLTREDGTQRFGGLDVSPPPGLIGKLAGIPYCPDSALGSIPGTEGTGAAQLAHPSCPVASQVGTVSAGAGAGPSPFYVDTGKAYLAGPYKGAPLSLAVVTPALAGPFDLGNVVVRNALRVNPETAQIEAVSDPLPIALFGIPLDLRDLRVNIDRPNFTLNPTSCNPMAVNGTLSGTEGASANVSERFQALGCDRLGFKPKLTLRLKGKTSRGANPALRATLTMPKTPGANIAKAQVTLPHSEFLDQAHIRTVCTRVQFAANACPAGSVYGHARAFTPLLDQPLEGPVYLRSSSHPLPDLVADLNGQIHVVLDGRIDSVKGGIRNTFEVVPDAPVSKFVLTMQGDKKGLLENSTDLCAATHKATVLFDAQNGKAYDTNPVVRADCGKGKRTAHNQNFNRRSPR